VRASPVDIACGVVSAAMIVSGRHFALDRQIYKDLFDPRLGARPVGLGHWHRREAKPDLRFRCGRSGGRVSGYCLNSCRPLRTAARIIAYRVELSLYFDPFPERIQNDKC